MKLEDFNVTTYSNYLSSLACNVACSIDHKILGREEYINYSEIKQLSEILSNESRKNHDDLDPSGVLVLWHTLIKYHDNAKIKHVDELMPKVALVSSELRDIDYKPKKRVKTLKDFCLSLSKQISVYSSPVRMGLVA